MSLNCDSIADSKFPTSSNSDAIPPSPTRENPAAVRSSLPPFLLLSSNPYPHSPSRTATHKYHYYPIQVYPKSDPSRKLLLLLPLSLAQTHLLPSTLLPSTLNPAAPSGTIPGTGPPHPPHHPRDSSSSSPLGNPFLLRSVLDDLDASLGRAVDAVRSEGGSSLGSGGEGGGGGGADLLNTFERWRDELDRIRAGDRQVPSRVGTGTDLSGREGGGGAGAGVGVMRGRKGVRPEDDPSSAESGGMFVD